MPLEIQKHHQAWRPDRSSGSRWGEGRRMDGGRGWGGRGRSGSGWKPLFIIPSGPVYLSEATSVGGETGWRVGSHLSITELQQEGGWHRTNGQDHHVVMCIQLFTPSSVGLFIHSAGCRPMSCCGHLKVVWVLSQMIDDHKNGLDYFLSVPHPSLSVTESEAGRLTQLQVYIWLKAWWPPGEKHHSSSCCIWADSMSQHAAWNLLELQSLTSSWSFILSLPSWNKLKFFCLEVPVWQKSDCTDMLQMRLCVVMSIAWTK